MQAQPANSLRWQRALPMQNSHPKSPKLWVWQNRRPAKTKRKSEGNRGGRSLETTSGQMPGTNLCPPNPHSMQTPPVRTVHKSRHRSNSTCSHGRRRKQPDPHNPIGRWYRRIRYDLTSQHAPRTLNCARSKLLPPLRSPVLHRPIHLHLA